MQYDDEAYNSKAKDYYQFARPEMIPFIPVSANRILEVGCGGGSFAAELKKNRPGLIIWGIEPNAQAAALAAVSVDRSICAVFERQMKELDGEKFDCIVFNDVLEHLVNPEEALKAAATYLNAGGSIVASIPNILFFRQIAEILLKQDWRYRNEGILDRTHLRFFTKKSMVRMFESNGFEIARICGIRPSRGLKYDAFIALTLGFTKDWRYPQFAVEARVPSVRPSDPRIRQGP